LSSDEPFILVLRSFEEFPLQQEDVFNKRESEYETVDDVKILDSILNFPIKALYAGKIRSCCSENLLKKSLFLISNDHWNIVVETLMQKCIFIILLPGSTNNFLLELQFVSESYLDKSYLFLPRTSATHQKRVANWSKTQEEFQKKGLKLPYYDQETDSLYKVGRGIMEKTSIEHVYELHKSTEVNSISEVLKSLIIKNYISYDYLIECQKHFAIENTLSEYEFEDFVDDLNKNIKAKIAESSISDAAADRN
jgi:hypothetical protein